MGLFYYNSDSRIYNTANFPTFGLKFTTDDLYSTENKSAFAHVNYKLTDRFSLSGGLRYSDESKSNFFRHIGQFVFPAPLDFGGNHVSFKAGADFQATDNIFVYASVSDGFTSSGVTPRIFTAEQLRPLEGEEVINYELGAKIELFDKKLRMNSAIFYPRLQESPHAGHRFTVQPRGQRRARVRCTSSRARTARRARRARARPASAGSTTRRRRAR